MATGDSFRWTGEALNLNGRTWTLEGEFRARRMRSPYARASPSGLRARDGHWDVVIAYVGRDAQASGSLTRVVSDASVMRLHLGDCVRDRLAALPDRDRDDTERGTAAGLLAGQMSAEARQRLEECEAALHARFELRPRLSGHRVAVDAKLDVRVFVEVDQEWSHNASSMRLANGDVLKKSAKVASGQEAPLLGQAASGFRERTVAAPLRPYFASIWIHRAADTPRRSAIVPDGCADLVFADGVLRIAGPDRRVKIEFASTGTDGHRLTFSTRCCRTMVANSRCSARRSHLSTGILLGIRGATP